VCEGLVAVAVSLEKRRAGGQHLAPCTSLRLLLRLRHTASYLASLRQELGGGKGNLPETRVVHRCVWLGREARVCSVYILSTRYQTGMGHED
jgi:hypothetical protein